MTSPSDRPQLKTLEDKPMTWDELRNRNARYWSMREAEEQFEPMQMERVYYQRRSGYVLRRPSVPAPNSRDVDYGGCL